MTLGTRGHGTLLIASAREAQKSEGLPDFPRKAYGFPDHRADSEVVEKQPRRQKPMVLVQEDSFLHFWSPCPVKAPGAGIKPRGYLGLRLY